MSNFVQDYLAGNASLEDIDNYISTWHNGNSKKELHEFLGLSFDEFALFVQNQDLLPAIIKNKKVQPNINRTKADVVLEIANNTGIDKTAVQNVIEDFFSIIKSSMSQGTNLYFRGFGNFVMKRRSRNIAHNIAKNTSEIIEPHNVPEFKPAKTFVEEIRKKVKPKNHIIHTQNRASKI